ncbi:MAG: glucose-6-phosphate isomerase [Planctomycetota bacterium]|nr:glucose-6-phosphate isomerase [Planctomycetota bacterium]
MGDAALWQRFQNYLLVCDECGVTLDISRMRFSDSFLQDHDAAIRRALAEMDKLEAGAIANPDENRMVGHYWLRDSSRAPTPEIKEEIDVCLANVGKFARAVHAGKIKPQKAKRFTRLLVVGIGGSALGPQFVARALGSPAKDKLTPFFFDNTDPDGMDLVLEQIGAGLKETLCVVISKSGGTKETRNGMLEAQRAYEAAGLKFGAHTVAITQEGSALDKTAVAGDWLARFPMWDWVGGRTSETSAVGLLPAALQGLDIRSLLAGAKAMDDITRRKDPLRNPAALLALMWYYATGGKGAKDMVILPYKDRLELFSKYLQQLIMESLGKEKDLAGTVVNQGIAVYGNKGSTDQHAYVQQLREGVRNFFVTFIEVLKDRAGRSMQVEDGVTSGDYLNGFHQGTRAALYENGRESITITVPDTSAQTVGKLIALYERAVGLYATLANINAYHQPGVEAGKKAAGAVIALQRRIAECLKQRKGARLRLEEIAEQIGAQGEIEAVFKILQHLSANPDYGVKRHLEAGKSVFDATYSG